jgi:HEAT repeat protein
MRLSLVLRVVVLAALVMPATAQYKTRDQIVSDHISDLTYPDWRIRHGAVYTIAGIADGYPQYRYEITNALVERIRRDSYWRVRQAAAIALCRFSVPQDLRKAVVDSLIGALQNDPHEGVRESAADTLGKLGDARAIDPLIEALKNDTNEIVQGTAAESLAMLGDAKAIDPLIGAFTHESGFVRLFAASSLVKQRRTEYLDQVVLALNDETPGVRRSAAHELGEIGDERTVDPLIEALEDEDSIVPESAAEALKKIQAPMHSAPDEVNEYIFVLRSAKNGFDRMNAAWALGSGRNRGPWAVDPLIEALKDEDDRVRVAAATSLGLIGDPKAVDSLIEALKDESLITDDAWRARYSAAASLGDIGDLRAIDPLTYAASNDEEDRVRIAAVEALEKIRAGR